MEYNADDWKDYHEAVAKISNIAFGNYDISTPILTFSTDLILEGGGALQVLGRWDCGLETTAFLRKQQARDIRSLNGKPIKVMVENNQHSIAVHPDEFDWGHWTLEDRNAIRECNNGKGHLVCVPREESA